jgi:hypothetical protein
VEEYFARFLEMVEELNSTPYIQVLNFELFKPARPQDISNIEEMLGCPLVNSIKNFYMLSNGLQLKWIHKENPSFDARQHCYKEGGFDYLEPMEWYGPEDGCINILPLQVAFVEQDWDDIVWSYTSEGKSLEFGGSAHNLLELMQRVKPLDIFSKSSGMVFLLEEGVANPKVLLTQDHFAEVGSSRITHFSSYLEFILHHWGLVAERRKFYNEYGGHEMPMVVTPAEYWEGQLRPNLRELYK